MAISPNPVSYCLLAVLLLSTPAFGAFNNIEIGARPVAVGGAFVAMADDVNALAYNASGIGYLEDLQAGGTHSEQFGGLIYHSYLAVVIPLGSVGRAGFGYTSLEEDSKVYREQSIIFSYAKRIGAKISLGGSLKSLKVEYSGSDVDENPYFAKSSASAFSADFGVLAKPTSDLNLGISLENIFPANLSISADEKEVVSKNLRGGLAYNLSSIAPAAEKEKVRDILRLTTLTSESGLRFDDFESKSFYFRLGIESWVHKNLALRGGYQLIRFADSTSVISFGSGLKVPVSSIDLRFDYAFQIALNDLNSPASHRVSTNFIF